ncbi:MAG: hypothetical protein NTY77_07115 [Elusimicrobia bacterium]|nr:hypothetical protein [Elusimicrobiota bacterium]
MKRTWAAATLALCGLLASGCKPPSHSLYTSPNRDFQCDVPWAWSVIYDSEGTHFTNLTFIGPFEPEFYLGAPSFSVRWYTRYATHLLRDGQSELYSGPDDFIKQILDSVYGKERIMFRPVQDMEIDGRKFKYFVVSSLGPAAPGARWGTGEQDGKLINPRKHAYAILPMSGGFYVLTYPATIQAYDAEPKTRFEKLKIYRDQFDELVHSFVPLKDGPGGSPLPPPSRSKPAK